MTAATAATANTANPFAVLDKQTKTADAAADTQASADRFLTLLVTQLKNQDPLNPLDNAQITSQMAQINAVTGLEKVNQSVKALATQMLQMQALQGAALVGREVMVEGERITAAEGKGRGAIELAGRSDQTRVEIVDGSKGVIATIDLGGLPAGRHEFVWNAARVPAGDYAFRVVGTLAGKPVDARTLTIDRVQSVAAGGDSLELSLARGGTVAAADVIAFQ